MELQVELGTRSDPFRQDRAARDTGVLIHSLVEFREIFERIFRHALIKTVVEIGVEAGHVSHLYVELGASKVHCVDPAASTALRASLSGHGELHLVTKPSPQALDELPVADLYVIDGDHNYWTVYHKVDWIRRNAPNAVVVLHDLSWPCARRDMYYLPSFVPAEARHPNSADGVSPWVEDLIPTGFRGAGAFNWATHAGGEQNGSLTAVEDVLRLAEDNWHFELIPAVFGMGLIVPTAAGFASELIAELRPYFDSALLAAMENNRIALYTRLLEVESERDELRNEVIQLRDQLRRSLATRIVNRFRRIR
jgi:hypothetical protein